MKVHAQTIEVGGQRVAVLPEPEYLKLLKLSGLGTSDSDMPGLPKKLPGGGYPALEYLRANLARDIVQARRDLGLSQAELARRAGMLPAALNRIERGRVDPGVSTVERIDRALKAAERRASQARSAARLKR